LSLNICILITEYIVITFVYFNDSLSSFPSSNQNEGFR